MARKPEFSLTSDYLPSSFLRADSDGYFNIRDEDLAVSDPARFGRFDDRIDGVASLFIPNNHFNLNLGKEVHIVMARAIVFRINLLPAKPLDLTHCHPADAHSLQCLSDLVAFERLNDGFYFLHANIANSLL
jgi:hypothetical protein